MKLSQDVIPDTLKHFILKNFDSIELLEVLLLLRKCPHLVWTIQAINQDVRSDLDSISNRVNQLLSLRFISLSDSTSEVASFKYAPHSPEIDKLISEVAHYYCERRFAIIDLIFAKPRLQGIRTFADAFCFKKDK